MDAICIASGPSLVPEDVDYCRGKGRVYVVNDCHKLAPWADVLYACDKAWWEYYNGVPEFKGEKWTLNFEAAKMYGLKHIGLCGDDWSDNPEAIATGRNSGFQALNLAVNQGASRVILLGYDMGFKDKRHWFGDHPNHGNLNRDSNYKEWIKCFNRAAPRIPVEVINCSRESALTCFPRSDLRDVI